jgi:hypothetical protein
MAITITITFSLRGVLLYTMLSMCQRRQAGRPTGYPRTNPPGWTW